jgi:hypothetical protein
MKKLAALIVLLSMSVIPADAKPFYKRWQFYVGAGVILAANLADRQTTCHRPGYIESNYGAGCATATGLLLGGAAGEIALNAVAYHIDRNERSKPWQFIRDWSVPSIVSGMEGWAAYHNSQLFVPVSSHRLLPGYDR